MRIWLVSVVDVLENDTHPGILTSGRHLARLKPPKQKPAESDPPPNIVLEIDPNNAAAWYNLGVLDGGIVLKKHYDKKSCYMHVLEIDPNHAKAWNSLGSIGGGVVSRKFYDTKSCYDRAAEITRDLS